MDDPGFAGCTPAQILALVPDEFTSRHACLFIVDKATVSSADWPVLVMDLDVEKGRMFRAVAEEVHGIEANLAIGNLDFSFYAQFAEDAGGIFRGGGPSKSEIVARLQDAVQKRPSKAMEAMLRPEPPAR